MAHGAHEIHLAISFSTKMLQEDSTTTKRIQESCAGAHRRMCEAQHYGGTILGMSSDAKKHKKGIREAHEK